MGKARDEKGNRYHYLTVRERGPNTKHGHAQWWCNCDCGGEVLVSGSNLRMGYTKSCGCLRREKAAAQRLIDLTGKRFGSRTVIGLLGSRGGKPYWLVRCDCGTESEVSGESLRRKHAQSCGCLRSPNLTGQTFGRRAVIEQVENNKWGQKCWLVRCECGAESVVTGSDLQRGTAQSCGCLARDMTRERQSLPDGQAAANKVLSQYKRDAADKGRSFTLTDEEFFTLTKMPCHYCGQEPSATLFNSAKTSSYIYTGIDRVDSSKGYERDNVVPCCMMCNRAKNAMSVKEFREWLRQISRVQFPEEQIRQSIYCKSVADRLFPPPIGQVLCV